MCLLAAGTFGRVAEMHLLHLLLWLAHFFVGSSNSFILS
jgi:hypothetical protein